MTTHVEKLKAGIESLTYRIAALAERLPTESTNRGDDPRATVRQINEYTRAKRALQAELDFFSDGSTAESDESPIVGKELKIQDHTKSEDVTDQQPFWKRNR